MHCTTWASALLALSLLCSSCVAWPSNNANVNANLLHHRQERTDNRAAGSADATSGGKENGKGADREDNGGKTKGSTRTRETDNSRNRATTTAKADQPETEASTVPPTSTETDSSESEASSSRTTPSSTTALSTSPTDAAQATSTGEPEPQKDPDSGGSVSKGGIAAGVIIGAAVAVGVLWIALAKWREFRRHKGESAGLEKERGSDIPNSGAGAAAAEGASDDAYNSSSSHDPMLSAVGAARSSAGSAGLNRSNRHSIRPLSRAAYSYELPPLQHTEGPHHNIPQDVLPPPSLPTQHQARPLSRPGDYQPYSSYSSRGYHPLP